MRKQIQNFVDKFPENSRHIVKDWITQKPIHDKIDIIIIKYFKYLWRFIKRIFVK